MDEKLYNAKEASERMRISLSLLYKIVSEKRIRAVRIGGRHRRGKVLIPEDAIKDFVDGCCAELED